MAVRAVHVVSGVVALQVVFAVVISILSSTALTGSDGACYLNLSGGTCQFLAITGYFSLLFSTMAAAGAYFTLRSGPGSYVPSAVGHIQAFGSLWWLAAAATATARGQQAADSGLPQGSARTGVMVLSWLEFALFVCAVLAVAYDRVMQRRNCIPVGAQTAPMLAASDVESQSSQTEIKLPEFKPAAVYVASAH
ncbi:hypothetical protein D9Q98_005877 [Chlorella vulgaris]|uniref:MARVEL domain-containing protein n=1 Tax=Chlorella vulgaris TaxID=3077 RepID=A0A9D4TX08_CHLVU|nr:hypothetical protein D9Q98_005877 [Chlorella vulgaris]